MRTIKLIALALKYHWNAQKSNPANLYAGTIGMVVNNLIVLWGLWVMLFNGKPDGGKLTIYFLSLNAMIVMSWGLICFFFGGIRSLAEFIEEGSLEPMLATPRSPLILVGISQSITPALGDIVQGCLNMVALLFIASFTTTLKCLAFVLVSSTAFLALFILAGSLPFFVRRGSALSQLLVECSLSLSFYPTGKIFSDRGRIFLYLTPAAVTGVLPMDAIDSGNWQSALIAITAAAAFFWISLKVFQTGLLKYQSASYVNARG